MKIVKYWVVEEIHRSSTPNDTVDDYIVIDTFEKEKAAKELCDKLEKEIVIKIRENPSFYNTHTEYRYYSEELKLK